MFRVAVVVAILLIAAATARSEVLTLTTVADPLPSTLAIDIYLRSLAGGADMYLGTTGPAAITGSLLVDIGAGRKRYRFRVPSLV